MNWEIDPEPMKTHPMEGCTWVRAIAHIRLNATGEVRKYATSEVLQEGDKYPSVFNWEENNYACDCNRALFFARAKGEDEPDVECGDGLYSVNLYNAKTGEVYYNEFSESCGDEERR